MACPGNLVLALVAGDDELCLAIAYDIFYLIGRRSGIDGHRYGAVGIGGKVGYQELRTIGREEGYAVGLPYVENLESCGDSLCELGHAAP